MLKPITEEIYTLVVPIPYGGSVNCYFIRAEKGFTLLDTGIYSDHAVQLWEKLIDSGVVIENIVLTHTHPDHIGMAAWLQKRLQVPVAMARLGHQAVRHQHEHQPDGWFLKHGAPVIEQRKYYDTPAFEPDVLFEDNDEVRLGDKEYKAIWTPGHATDHFCFYNETNRVLFIGDHVLGDVSPVIIVEREEANPLQDYFESLEKVQQYPVDLVLPGHGEAICDLQQRIAEIKDGHHTRFQQILEKITENGVSAGEISRLLYHRDQIDVRSMSEFQMTLARLIYLESQGQISSHIQPENQLVNWILAKG